jgi:hypothetical protein
MNITDTIQNQRAWKKVLKEKDWGEKFSLLIKLAHANSNNFAHKYGKINGEGIQQVSKRNAKKSSKIS